MFVLLESDGSFDVDTGQEPAVTTKPVISNIPDMPILGSEVSLIYL